ncbi:hypothetical protein SteCoe_29846 [Stentor coeruleus]|uniref:Uncharacterized protein n=1 Tax=Stentor coeruleus TaxID=5963 RepID=A0A1R2B511_9CILI|nr:hypothetical protein SteCoe_29846 [Stentor coeruleus]
MENFYIISNKNKSQYCKFYVDECDSGCSYEDLLDLQCSKKCNTTLCGYDNLNCLRTNECFNFMLGDGYCNSMCPSDPDCSYIENNNDSDYYLLIIAIVIPIICGVLLIVVILFIVFIIKSSETIKNLRDNLESKEEAFSLMNIQIFDDKTNYNGEALCILDIKVISIGDKVAIMKNCTHIFHYNCMIKRYEKEKTYECFTCNQNNRELNGFRQIENRA